MSILDYLRSLFQPKPVLPAAILMLKDFNGTAARMDAFKAQPNDGAKYVWYTHGLFPPREVMGIPAGWINAVMYEGLLNGKNVSSFGEVPPDGGFFSWAGGTQPAYYEALGPFATGDGRHSLEKYLLDMANASPYLRSIGLTAEAVASAAGHEH